MYSLQTRLGLGLVISLVILFGLQWLIVSTSIRYLTEGYIASRLQRDIENMLTALTIRNAGLGPLMDPGRVDPIYKRPFSGHYFRINVAGQTIRSRSLWDQDLAVPPTSHGDWLKMRTPGPQGQTLLLVAMGFKKKDRDVVIAVAEDMTPIETDIRRFQIRYGLASLVILIVLIVLQQKIVSLGMTPIEKARRDISSLERGEIKNLEEDVPTELKPFIQEINRLLEAIKQRLRRSRNAAGNLAHALKAPLTLLVRIADRDELQRYPDVRHELIEQTDTVRILLDRELKRARLAGAAQPGQPLSLKDDIDALSDALKKIYPAKSLDIQSSLPPHRVVIGDREDMLELLGNLLDNACKWARQRVILNVGVQPGVLISVEDDGPGCPPEELGRLSVRGVRIDESTVGHGLGLAIVKDIVEQYSGEIGFGRSDRLGGFRVWVNLPPFRS